MPIVISRASPAALFGLLTGCLVLVSLPQDKQERTGKVPYDRECRVCHGPEGRGDAGPRLVPFRMEFDELLARVREGGGEMPPVSARRVTDEEVQQIGAYLTSLSISAEPPRAKRGSTHMRVGP